MRRGDVFLVDLEPARGAEANKRRPAIIVSNDHANGTVTRLGRGVVTIVPITTNISRIYSFQVFLPSSLTGLRRDSKAQGEQVRSVTIERIGAALGHVPQALMAELDQALRLHLAL